MVAARRRARCAALVMLAAWLLAACGGATWERFEGVLRPTRGESPVYRGWGEATVHHADGCGGACRVHWAVEGEHAVPTDDDAPANGRPDRVDAVLATAEGVLDTLRTRGWWRPLRDDRAGLADDGGSPAVDLYLVHFARGDGTWRTEACRRGRCTGHLAMDRGPDHADADWDHTHVPVLVSHELFHGVQAARRRTLPAWWSEGSATAFQEAVQPGGDDAARLAARFFRHPGRSLLAPLDGSMDGWPYAASLWLHHLSHQAGPRVLQRALRDPYAPARALVRAAGGPRRLRRHMVSFACASAGAGQDGWTPPSPLWARMPGWDAPTLPLPAPALLWEEDVAPWALVPAEVQGATSVTLVDAPAQAGAVLWQGGRCAGLGVGVPVMLDGTPARLVLYQADPETPGLVRVRVSGSGQVPSTPSSASLRGSPPR
jgi:hypothetical protein